jgi:hypothetical protein
MARGRVSVRSRGRRSRAALWVLAPGASVRDPGALRRRQAFHIPQCKRCALRWPLGTSPGLWWTMCATRNHRTQVLRSRDMHLSPLSLLAEPPGRARATPRGGGVVLARKEIRQMSQDRRRRMLSVVLAARHLHSSGSRPDLGIRAGPSKHPSLLRAKGSSRLAPRSSTAPRPLARSSPTTASNTRAPGSAPSASRGRHIAKCYSPTHPVGSERPNRPRRHRTTVGRAACETRRSGAGCAIDVIAISPASL